MPDDLRPFIEFKASLRKIDLKREQAVAIFLIETTDCYIPVFLDEGTTVQSVKDELAEQEAEMSIPSEKVIEGSLRRISNEKKK